MNKIFRTFLIKLLYFISPIFDDKTYLKLLFPLRTGYKLNINKPQTYNEKLQWLKLNYRDPLLPKLVDKYEYKLYVDKVVGSQYVVKNFGIWDSFDDIDFELLPNQFVLKTTHDQGGVVICVDKSQFNLQSAKKKLKRHLRKNLYYAFREWPYKYIKPRIIAEEYLAETSVEGLKDYKFYCFNGKPEIMYISSGRQSDVTSFGFFDMNFKVLNIKRPHYKQFNDYDKPKRWSEMIDLATTLSAGQPHVRIDFYEVDDRLLLGEYTLFQGGGMMPFYPFEWDLKMGNMLLLPN